MEKFPEVLAAASSHLDSPLVVFIDGLDLLDDTDMARTLNWVPETLPKVSHYSHLIRLFDACSTCSCGCCW